MSAVRVRFAPSPTGYLHIGGLRTALFNWLFARNKKGSFLLRIEDTDFERSRAEFATSILESLAWADLESDEQVVIQSKRMDLYQSMIEKLLHSGKAYRCFCAESGIGDSEHGYTKYPGTCRELVDSEQHFDKPYAVRIKIPKQLSQITFNDLIRGPIVFERDQFDDFIIARTDGVPIYNFVVVVDDAAMDISHIIRGEDHISNTPKQIILYQALEFKVPLFAHLPLILAPSGARLSKRDAATAVEDYRKKGYLATALCNYLVRLGWSHGDQEIFTRQEMINYFSLDGVGKKGAIFDQQKLDWMNGMYIRNTPASQLLELIIRDVESNLHSLLSGWKQKDIEQVISLYQDRVKTLSELVHELIIVHDGPTVFNPSDMQQWITPDTLSHLTALLEQLQRLDQFDVASITAVVKELTKKLHIKIVTIAQPIRLALMGKASGPGVFELLTIIGKHESNRRIARFIDLLQNRGGNNI